jgi:hypothetical protein
VAWLDAIRITTAAVAVAVAACGASAKEVRLAQTSGYDADFAIVFSEALAAVQELYPHLDENPSAGWIKTAWHPLRVNQESTGGGGNVPTSTLTPSGGALSGSSTTAERKFYFVRFRVYVLGGRPWRVRVEGEASEYEIGDAQPVPLHGADVPGWLKGRTEALQVAIYDRLRGHAVQIQVKNARAVEPAPSAAGPAADAYGDLPAAATLAIDRLRAALLAGELDAARAQVSDDLVWALGAAPGAEQAMALWKADPSLVSALVRVIEAGCAVIEGSAAIECPAAPSPGDYRAVFRRAGEAWKLASFYAQD